MPDGLKPKPSGDHTLEQVEAFRPFAKLLDFFNPNIRKNFGELEYQIANVKQVLVNRDQFVKIYSPLGWINYDRLSTTIVARALELPLSQGEDVLTEHHLDPQNLRHLGFQFFRPHYQPWSTLFERAVERAAAMDFLSAVPLVLIIIDGICLTTTGKHPFSGGADAPVFDTQTSGPGGLAEGLALFGSKRRKLDSEALSTPFRHGIFHGLNPNYGSKLVTAKAFNLLQATVDYFDRRRDEAERLEKAAEEQQPIDLQELGQILLRNAETRKALDTWQPRPMIENVLLNSSDSDTNLPVGSPEAFAAEYLTLLINKNYGRLAGATVDYPQRPIGYRAGRLRDDLKGISVERWSITGVEDTSPAMSSIATKLDGTLNVQSWSGEHLMRLMFADENNEALVRGLARGTWIVMPDYLTGIWAIAIHSARDNKH